MIKGVRKLRWLNVAMVGMLLPLSIPMAALAEKPESQIDLLLQGKAAKSPPAKFRVIFREPVETKYAVEGDPVEAYLQQDLVIDNHLIASADSPVFGHIESITRSRKFIESARDKNNRFNRSSKVKIVFDRIGDAGKDQVLIDGALFPQNAVFSNGEKFRRIIVGPEGDVVKAESLDIKTINEIGLAVPESTFTFKDRYQINIEPGDSLLVRAEVTGFDEAKLDVSAHLVSKKKDTQKLH